MLKFRPHHFMCTLAFQGKGYSPEFIQNYSKIYAQITENPETLIEVSSTLDSICQACPHQTAKEACDREHFIRKLDQAHQKALGLKNGERLSWSNAKELIKEKLTLEKFSPLCEGCSWKPYGICETALKDFLSGIE